LSPSLNNKNWVSLLFLLPFPQHSKLPLLIMDDVVAIVLDMGSVSVKAGFHNEDAPRAVFSSVVGWCF
jgi:hypothetical protein